MYDSVAVLCMYDSVAVLNTKSILCYSSDLPNRFSSGLIPLLSRPNKLLPIILFPRCSSSLLASLSTIYLFHPLSKAAGCVIDCLCQRGNIIQVQSLSSRSSTASFDLHIHARSEQNRFRRFTSGKHVYFVWIYDVMDVCMRTS